MIKMMMMMMTVNTPTYENLDDLKVDAVFFHRLRLKLCQSFEKEREKFLEKRAYPYGFSSI